MWQFYTCLLPLKWSLRREPPVSFHLVFWWNHLTRTQIWSNPSPIYHERIMTFALQQTGSYINDVALRVPVVCPHVHVEQDLFVETSGQRCQRVLKAPCLLCSKSKISDTFCKHTVAHRKYQVPSLPRLLNLRVQMQLCAINEFWMSHHTWLPLIKVAGVRSLGKSRVDYSKHPPQSWVRTAPLPTHHAPELHTWLLSWGASARLPHPANKACTPHFTQRKYSNTRSARMHLITNVSPGL